MSVGLAIVAALASSACAALSNVLQHGTAKRGPEGTGLRLGLLWHLLHRPVWLAGFAAAGAALVLHAVALDGAQLGVVQPILVSAVLFALPASALLEHRRPSAVEWSWAALLVAGLGGFLVLAMPSAGRALPSVPLLAACLTGAAVLGALAVLVGGVALPRYRASLFGLASGIAYGMVAPLLKLVLAQVTAGSNPATWILAGLIMVAVGAVAVVLNQAAYQAGPLSAVLPPWTLADPLVATAIGAIAFGDRLQAGPWAVAGEVVAACAVAVAVTQLARRTPVATADRPLHPASTPLEGLQ
ncbi:DMT family transporter [Frondihabitans australicus]|uniref:Magnesium transporter NIPA n=1 Tax=Frondihabitans australicus TaxID=386892 RepID=A0A495IDZ3_9MICO|nr:DMT family transporter [Frondihabitans australicus]RKR73345.1 hypothetical protein C8E83_0437 [Frondihabitans australicus]